MDTVMLMGIIALLVGIILLVIAWIISRKKTTFYSKAVRTEGTVIALIKRESDESKSTTPEADETISDPEKISRGFIYAPKVEYHGSAGEVHVIEGKTFSYPPKYKIGDKIILFYDMNHPEKGVIDSFMEKWLAVIILSIFGGIFFLVGLIIQFAT